MAEATPCVRRVTVEYWSGGKIFTVEFDPMKIGAIFFNEAEVIAAQEKQRERTKKSPVIKPFKPHMKLQEQGFGELVGAKTIKEVDGQAARPPGPSLWWHVNACTWFHDDETVLQ